VLLFVKSPHRRVQAAELVAGERRDDGLDLHLAVVLAGQTGGAQPAEPEGAAEGAAARRRGGESEQICDRSRT
jgi:hypothetical protein